MRTALACLLGLALGPALAAEPTAAAERMSIAAVQGTGPVSPLVGRQVSVTGVVTGLSSSGFYLQEMSANAREQGASHGLQVHTRQRQGLAPGVRVRVTARVEEFAPGGARGATAGGTTTQLTDVSTLELLGTGDVPLPLPLQLPLPAGQTLERYEGMRVALQGPLTVTQNQFLSRYGQLTLAAGGRQQVPSDRHRPGAAARELARAQADRRIVLDDGRSAANPSPVPFLGSDGTVRAGDTLAVAIGVIDQGPIGASAAGPMGYRLQALVTPVIQRSNPRTPAPRPVGGQVRVAGFNVLNYFLTVKDGRGADSDAELQRQRAKIVAALVAIDADVLGLMEIENRPDAAQDLADALNRMVGAGRYAVVGAGTAAATAGTDAIQVAMLYQPARLQLAGAAQRDERPVHHRPPLAQAFRPRSGGEAFSVVVSHFKSKRCDADRAADDADADQGDGQGCFNARRLRQAQALADFARAQGPRSLLIGDFNAYTQEDPMQQLRDAGFVDLVERFEPGAYSYLYDGLAGRIDHALASPALAAQASGATVWHINADEPPLLDYNLEGRQPACARCAPDGWRPDAFRASDHDPVIVGLRAGAAQR